MTNEATINKLIEMRLTAMADAFRIQLQDNGQTELSLEERIGLLVDIEYNSRKNNRLKRLIKKATFDQPHACIADINYSAGRKLNRSLINSLATCSYVAENHNIMSNRSWQILFGLCFWYGSLQTVLYRQIHKTAGVVR